MDTDSILYAWVNSFLYAWFIDEPLLALAAIALVLCFLGMAGMTIERWIKKVTQK